MRKKGSQLPRLFGFQAEGASPIVQNKVIKTLKQLLQLFELVIQLVGQKLRMR